MSDTEDLQKNLTVILPTHTPDRSTTAALLAMFSSRFPLLKDAQIEEVKNFGTDNRLLKIHDRTFRFHYMTSTLPAEVIEEVLKKSPHLQNKDYLPQTTGFYMITAENGPQDTCHGQQKDAAYLSTLAATICTLQESNAVIWGATGVGFDGTTWVEATSSLFDAHGNMRPAGEREHLLWTQIQPIVRNNENKDLIGMRLDGMIPYIGREIEVIAPNTPADELIDITLGLASYFFEHGDDDKINFPEGDGFAISEAVSAADKKTPVYILKPMAAA